MGYKIDIFRVLDNATDGNFDFYQTLTETEQKALSYWLVMVWCWGTAMESGSLYHLYFIHQELNKRLTISTQHPELFWGVLCSSVGGMGGRYKFPKKTSHTSSQKARITLISDYYGVTEREAIDLLKLFDDDELLELCEDIGYTDEQIKGILK